MKKHPDIFTIPSGQSFVDTLAAGILQTAGGAPETMPAIRILLPTRRACRALREAFLRRSAGRPMLLPRMHPLGDIDEEELRIKESAAGFEDDIPPALSPMHRQILLARTIQAIPDYSSSPDQALALAGALGRLMDQIMIEDLSFERLHTLVPEDFAAHWQLSVDFLKILSEHWPKILDEHGVIDPADRRNRLIRKLSRLWQDAPPQTPVIAAGSTGTIPATADLLQTVARLPQGSVILPGLDTDMDAESWEAMTPCHPQAALKDLLLTFGIKPQDIKTWPYACEEDGQAPRRALVRDIMRPGETSGRWGALTRDAIAPAIRGLQRFDCDTEQDEAQLIALILRETLETPSKTAALVTPDRTLARRVAAACHRWGIMLDDSGGRPLIHTYKGSFHKLCLNAITADLKPVALLSLLKHGLNRAAPRDRIQAIEKIALRGNVVYRDLPALAEDTDRLDAQAKTVLQTLDVLFAPLLTLKNTGAHPLDTMLRTHIELAEALAGPENLWSGEDGEQAAALVSEILSLAPLFPPMSFESFTAIIERFFREASVRPAYGAHPRLMILGQLEARLLQADTMILGGLNEGLWPQDPGHDAWMSRPMRKQFGLPDMDARIGQSAHDFAQAFCAPTVILTRSKKTGGSPGVPARWLQRLDTVLRAADIPPETLSNAPWPAFAAALKRADTPPQPCQRPAPRPPVDKRPKTLPVTAIESWMRDPYAVYAKYVLNLRKLDALEEDLDAALRGSLIHDIFDRFITEFPDTLPENAVQILDNYAQDALGPVTQEAGFWSFWRPRFQRLTGWFLEHEREWRTKATPLRTEIQGTYTLPDLDFTLTAKADRIDRLHDGRLAVIDYKTGTPPPAAAVRSGFAPQLPLEALILREKGFTDIPAQEPGYLGFWKLSGGAEPGEEKEILPESGGTLNGMVDTAQDGLERLVRFFADENTPYYSLPRPDKAPRFQDYAHLARVQEWATQDAEEEAA